MEDPGEPPPANGSGVERAAAAACQACSQTLNLQSLDTSGGLCVACSLLEETMNKEPSVTSSEAEAESDVQRLTRELSDTSENCREVTLTKIERLQLQTEDNYTVAQQEIRHAMSELHSLLDHKETELLQTVEEVRESKLAALAESEERWRDLLNQVTELLSGGDASKQDLLSHGPSLLSSLTSPFPPHSSHITAHAGLGFCSDVKLTMTQAVDMCMWVSGEDVTVGKRMGVNAVGGLQSDGSFWVRQVHADPWRQELTLRHISNSLFEVPQTLDPLSECSLGQLCVAPFSQDGRWYRAVVVDKPKPGRAKFFFLDHGGNEEAAVSSLYPLPDHFRALPFQMIHVNLTTDPSIDFNTRAMRWRFTDFTHKKTLVADILSLCEISSTGPIYLIHLEDHTQAEPFDVGKILITSAKVKESQSKFRSRDIRFKDKEDQATPTIVSGTATSALPLLQSSVAVVDNGLLPEPLETVVDNAEPLETVVDNAEPLETVVDNAEPLETVVDNAEPLETVVDNAEPLETVVDNAEPVVNNAEPLETVVDNGSLPRPLGTVNDGSSTQPPKRVVDSGSTSQPAEALSNGSSTQPLEAVDSGSQPLKADNTQPLERVDYVSLSQPLAVDDGSLSQPLAVDDGSLSQPLAVDDGSLSQPLAVDDGSLSQPLAVEDGSLSQPLAVEDGSLSQPLAVDDGSLSQPLAVDNGSLSQPLAVDDGSLSQPLAVDNGSLSQPLAVDNGSLSQPLAVDNGSPAQPRETEARVAASSQASADSESVSVTKDTAVSLNSPSPPSQNTPSPIPPLAQAPPSQTTLLSQPSSSQGSSLSQPTPSHVPISQNSPLSQPSSSQGLPSPPSQNTPMSQLSPSHSQSADDTEPTPDPDSIPCPLGSDTIPPDSSSDSTPLRGPPEQSNSIPHSSDSDSVPSDRHSIPQLKPLQLTETESVLLNNEAQAPPTSDVIPTVEADIHSIHPRVQTGARLSVVVATELSQDGHFWCQLLFPPSESGEMGEGEMGEGEMGEGEMGEGEMGEGEGVGAYARLQDELQATPARGDLFTPVFYSEGDVCAASFSEDEEWYRARIEKVTPGMPHMTFTVRYLDFGNSEERQQHHLMVLGSKFKLLPPGAIHCSISTAHHNSFSAVEREKFDDLCGEGDITAEVLEVGEDGVVTVKLLQTLPDREPVDLTEKIYSAEAKVVMPTRKKMATRQWSSSNDLETQNTAHVDDWASHMEDQQEESVFLTLPGHESSRETTPSLREATPTRREGTPTNLREDKPRGLRGATPTLREGTPTKATLRVATPTNQREVTPTRREVSPTPTTRRDASPITIPQREATPTTRRDASPITIPQREATPTTRRDASPITIPQRETTPTTRRDASPITIPQREATPTTRRDASPITIPQREATPTSRRDASPITIPQREATPTSRRDASPIPIPQREATPTTRRDASPITIPQREATPTSRRDASPITIPQREATPTSRRDASPIPIPQREATPTQPEGSPGQRDAGATQWVPLKQPTFLQRVATSNHDSPRSSSSGRARLDINRAKHSIISSLGSKGRTPHHNDADPRGRAHLKLLKTNQRKLYVKCVPRDKTDSEIRELFGRYGDVIDIDPHTSDPTVLYVVMDVKGAEEAVANMNGYQITPEHRLVVEKYRTRSPSPPPPPSLPAGSDVLSGTDHVRLFVKNVPAEHDTASLRTLFSRYGRVLKILPDPKRRIVTYVYMDVEGGTKAINNLHGKAISKNGRPLIVELSHEPKPR